MSDVWQVTVTSCVPKQKRDGTVISGMSARGPWTMYEVMATRANGQPIQEDIITFAPLPLGDQMVKVETKHDQKFGDSHTFSPVDGNGAPARASSPADEGHEMLRQTIAQLAERVSALETAVKGLGGFGSTLGQTDVPVAAQPPVTVPAADEDIPF